MAPADDAAWIAPEGAAELEAAVTAEAHRLAARGLTLAAALVEILTQVASGADGLSDRQLEALMLLVAGWVLGEAGADSDSWHAKRKE